MHRKPFFLLVLLTMSAASRAATDDFESFRGVGWVWILVLCLYAVLAVILLLAYFKEITYDARPKQARAPQGLSNLDSRIAGRWAPRPSSPDVNLADFAPEVLDVHILDSDEIAMRIDHVVAPEVGNQRGPELRDVPVESTPMHSRSRETTMAYRGRVLK